MSGDRTNWIVDERIMRVVFAASVTIIGVATIATRNTAEVDWSLVVPTVALYWLWATIPSFPRAPLYLMGIGAPLALNIVASDSEVSMFLVVLTAAVIAAFEPNRILAVSLLVVTAIAIMVLGLTTAINEYAWPNWLFGIGFSWGFGEMAFRFKTTIDELEHARSLVADQAAVHERRRIARDVHDLVGHSLSVVMLHITGARHLVRKDPAEAERALEQAEAAGRESLAEIRRTVGMLRVDSDSPAPALPSPDLTDVASLVDEFLLAGVDIVLEPQGELAAVDSAAALAGYRIIQEALSNASRHAIGAHVVVSLDVSADTYDLTVRNNGGVSMQERKGSGFGLISMRERAKSVGGLLVAGPTPEGWTVEATLPTTATGDIL